MHFFCANLNWSSFPEILFRGLRISGGADFPLGSYQFNHDFWIIRKTWQSGNKKKTFDYMRNDPTFVITRRKFFVKIKGELRNKSRSPARQTSAPCTWSSSNNQCSHTSVIFTLDFDGYSYYSRWFARKPLITNWNFYFVVLRREIFFSHFSFLFCNFSFSIFFRFLSLNYIEISSLEIHCDTI